MKKNRQTAAKVGQSPTISGTPRPKTARAHAPALRRLASAVCLTLGATFNGFLGLIPAHADPEPAQAISQYQFDASDIISDAVFYDTSSMTEAQIRNFINTRDAGCNGASCLKNIRLTTPDEPADAYCAAYRAGAQEDAAAILSKVSTACGINPQVMLVTLEKESGLLTRTDVTESSYDAAFGWHCPDTGPGGSANCDPAYAGFFNQSYGMAKQWARYRIDPARYNYHAGQTANILWNVAESGCGSGPVTIANTATASLYNYTPYQPNAAALASFPGTGDACSAYGNRNFSYLFQKYFGSTHRDVSGDAPAGTVVAPAVGATVDAVAVTIPAGLNVAPELAGQTITAPTPEVAAGLRAGFEAIGLPYVWGGGGSGSGPNNGCGRGGGENNSCGDEIGFDCSGLTAYVLGQAGYPIPDNSGTQRSSGVRISWNDAQPGDIVGFPGHVALYLGSFGGRPYILEASWVGTPIHIVPLTRTDFDPQLYRYWTGAPVTTPAAVDMSLFSRSAPAASTISSSSWGSDDGVSTWRRSVSSSTDGWSARDRASSSPGRSDPAPAAPSVGRPDPVLTTPPVISPVAVVPPAVVEPPASAAEPPVDSAATPPTPAATEPMTTPPTPQVQTSEETGSTGGATSGPGTGGSDSDAPESEASSSAEPAAPTADAPSALPDERTDAETSSATPAAPYTGPESGPELPEPDPGPVPAAPVESRPAVESTLPGGDPEQPAVDSSTAAGEPPLTHGTTGPTDEVVNGQLANGPESATHH